MTTIHHTVSNTAKLVELVSYLFDEKRNRPAIVVTNRSKGGESCFPPVRLQEMVGSGVRVFHLSSALLREFNHRMSNIFGIIPSGVRVYRYHMMADDHHARHPLWTEAKIDASDNFGDEILRYCAEVKRFEHGRDITRPTKAAASAPKPRLSTRPILRLKLPINA